MREGLSDEARAAQLAQDREVKDDEVDRHVVDADDVHEHVLNGDVVYAYPGMGGSV